jgi:hypothetical protein
MSLLISGALAMGYLVAAGFFFRFWRQTADRLFALFATAFLVLGIQRVLLATMAAPDGEAVWAYGLRLVAFLIILAAIVDKNRSPSS